MYNMNKEFLEVKKTQLQEQLNQAQAQINQVLGAIAMVDNLLVELSKETKIKEDANDGTN